MDEMLGDGETFIELAAKADEVAVFVAASESFSQRNINCSIAESIQRFQPIFDAARAQGVRVRGYVSCVVACPYEGAIAPAQTAAVAAELHAAGAYEVSLGDTIGAGTPGSVLRHRWELMFRRAALEPPTNAVDTTALLLITALL